MECRHGADAEVKFKHLQTHSEGAFRICAAAAIEKQKLPAETGSCFYSIVISEEYELCMGNTPFC